MGFHPVVLDSGVYAGEGSISGPAHATSRPRPDSGVEGQRFTRVIYPSRRFRIRHPDLTLAEANALRNFFLQRRGATHSFLWVDEADKTTATDHISAPADDDVTLGSGTTTYEWQALKKYNAGDNEEIRYIRKIVPGSVLLQVNSVAQTEGTDFFVDPYAGRISLLNSTTNVVTMGCSFYCNVRFDEATGRNGLNFAYNGYDSCSVSFGMVEEPNGKDGDDRLEVLNDLENFGGGKPWLDADVGTEVTLDLQTDGRVQSFDTTTNAITVKLPIIDNSGNTALWNYARIAEGGPHFIIVNDLGANDLTLQESFNGAAYGNLGSGREMISPGESREMWIGSTGHWEAI